MRQSRLRHIVSFLLMGVLCFVVTLRADEHSENEVRDLIGKVEGKISDVKSQGAESYSGSEISRIQNQIKNAQKLLENGNIDEAYYEIRIGIEYFNLIKARKRLLDAKTSFDKNNSGTSK